MDCYFEPTDYPFLELNEPKLEELVIPSQTLVDINKFSNNLNISLNGSHMLEIVTPLVNPNMVVPKMTSRSTENINKNVEIDKVRLESEFQNFSTNIKTEYHSKFSNSTTITSNTNQDISNKSLDKLLETITGKNTNTKVIQKTSAVTNDEPKPIRRRVYSMINDSSLLKMHQHPHSRVLPTRDFSYPKPPYSYSCLITLALRNSPTGKLRVSEIYNFLCRHFPYFLTAPAGWKNSVRHNLSLNKCFEKIEKPSSSGSQAKGCFWTINPTKFVRMEEEMLKCSRKDASTIRRSLLNPDDMEALEMGDFKNRQSFDAGDEVDIDSPDEMIDDVAANVPFTFTPNTSSMTQPVEISSKSNEEFLFDVPFHTGNHFSIIR